MVLKKSKPLIGVVMCPIEQESQPAQMVYSKYMEAIINVGGVPIGLPEQLSQSPQLSDRALDGLNGVVFTGSPSNIEPYHYHEYGSAPPADPARDTLAFALLKRIYQLKMPLLAICRGLHELVVSTGGTLYRHVEQLPGFIDHRADTSAPPEKQYAPAHQVTLEPGGLLSSLLPERTFKVNSAHEEGIHTLSDCLRIEARAIDGLIEAVSLRDYPFGLGVQWHPEWEDAENAFSQPLFARFVQACGHYQAQQSQPTRCDDLL